jgi:hypothetical protein
MLRIFCGISNEITNTLSILITAYSILHTLIYIDMMLIDIRYFALILDILELILRLLLTQIYRPSISFLRLFIAVGSRL